MRPKLPGMKVEEAGLRIRPWGLRTATQDLAAQREDVAFMIRRAAYADEIRHVALRARRIGWATLIAGVLMVAWAALQGAGMDSKLAYAGEASIGLGWLLFVHAMLQRTRYVRAHPFDPDR